MSQKWTIVQKIIQKNPTWHQLCILTQLQLGQRVLDSNEHWKSKSQINTTWNARILSTKLKNWKIHDQISEPDKPCWKIEYKTYLIISIEPLNTKSKIADTCSNTEQTKNPKNQVHRLSKIDQNRSHHKKFEQSNLKNLTRIQVNNKYVKIHQNYTKNECASQISSQNCSNRSHCINKDRLDSKMHDTGHEIPQKLHKMHSKIAKL